MTALTFGFGGLRDYYGQFSISPRLPEEWDYLTYQITLHGQQIQVTVREGEVELAVVDGDHKVGPCGLWAKRLLLDGNPW